MKKGKKNRFPQKKSGEEEYLENLLGGLLNEEDDKRIRVKLEEDGRPQPIQKKEDFSRTGVREFSLPLN